MVLYFIGVSFSCCKNIFQHSKRNFVSPRGQVISSMYFIVTDRKKNYTSNRTYLVKIHDQERNPSPKKKKNTKKFQEK